MCPGDMSFHTLEFDDHFVIAPAIKFFSRSNNFKSNALGENGRSVADNFEYTSDTNTDFLTVPQIQDFNK